MDHRFRKDTVVMTLFYSLMSGISVEGAVTETSGEQEAVR